MAKENVQEQENTDSPQKVTQTSLPEITEFRVGDTIRIIYKIIEGDKVRRTQPFEGIVISKKGSDVSKTFTVRRVSSDGIGVERIFPLYSPNIESVTVVKKRQGAQSKTVLFTRKNR